MGLLKLIHHILNPHCSECNLEKHENKVCASCETLEKQLEIANFEKKQLLDKLLKEPEVVEQHQPSTFTPPKTIPWKVRREMLERDDREKARLMRDSPRPDIDKLEKELGVDDGSAAHSKTDNKNATATN